MDAAAAEKLIQSKRSEFVKVRFQYLAETSGLLMSLGPDVSNLQYTYMCLKSWVPVFVGAKMKVSQLGRKLRSEHLVSQQVGEPQTKYVVL